MNLLQTGALSLSMRRLRGKYQKLLEEIKHADELDRTILSGHLLEINAISVMIRDYEMELPPEDMIAEFTERTDSLLNLIRDGQMAYLKDEKTFNMLRNEVAKASHPASRSQLASALARYWQIRTDRDVRLEYMRKLFYRISIEAM